MLINTGYYRNVLLLYSSSFAIFQSNDAAFFWMHLVSLLLQIEERIQARLKAKIEYEM